jgi:hypothetical protein
MQGVRALMLEEDLDRRYHLACSFESSPAIQGCPSIRWDEDGASLLVVRMWPCPHENRACEDGEAGD